MGCVCSPIGHSAAALHVNDNAPPLDLAPVRHLVRRLHVVLVLELDECVAPRLVCAHVHDSMSGSWHVPSVIWGLLNGA